MYNCIKLCYNAEPHSFSTSIPACNDQAPQQNGSGVAGYTCMPQANDAPDLVGYPSLTAAEPAVSAKPTHTHRLHTMITDFVGQKGLKGE